MKLPDPTSPANRGVGQYLPPEQGERERNGAGAALLLHDDESTLALVRTLVEERGLAAVAVKSVFELATAAAPPALRVVVLGMTAFEDRDLELVSVLRSRTPDASIFVLYPASLRERAAKALALGADASLQEPFYAQELRALTVRALARVALTPEPPLDDASAPPDADAPVAANDGAAHSVEQLAAGMAQSLRGPLDLVERQLGVAESGGAVDVAEMRAELVRIAAVVEDLTRFAGPRALDLRPVDLANLVTGVFASRDIGAGGAEIAVRLGEARVEILAAPDLLRVAFELVRNRAVRVTPLEGKIRVRTKKRVEAGRRMVEIAIDDGGPALTEDQCARVFEPFPDEQSVAEGTGLELAALAGIVRDHGGNVAARAAGAVGTTIEIRLPVKEEKGSPASRAR